MVSRLNTEAGRLLLDDLLVDLPYERGNLNRAILAIAAEARAALLAELEAGVERLPAAGGADSRMINRAAVLELIREAGKP